ncbi:MAG: hypothetical protein MUO22_07180 [Sedimentisphaerales bacterium]|nr:hypothetical protein [Sedimentisphaerales bacterium]
MFYDPVDEREFFDAREISLAGCQIRFSNECDIGNGDYAESGCGLVSWGPGVDRRAYIEQWEAWVSGTSYEQHDMVSHIYYYYDSEFQQHQYRLGLFYWKLDEHPSDPITPPNEDEDYWHWGEELWAVMPEWVPERVYDNGDKVSHIYTGGAGLFECLAADGFSSTTPPNEDANWTLIEFEPVEEL